jgi:hypothetical protein
LEQAQRAKKRHERMLAEKQRAIREKAELQLAHVHKQLGELRTKQGSVLALQKAEEKILDAISDAKLWMPPLCFLLVRPSTICSNNVSLVELSSGRDHLIRETLVRLQWQLAHWPRTKGISKDACG